MIYLTPYDPVTKQCTGPSTPSGATDMQTALLIFGAGWITCSKRTVVYPNLALTDYVLSC